MADGVYACKCHDCHMTFSSANLLQKHKRKFCVGSVGDPDSLLLRKGLRSEEDRSPRPISPDDRLIDDDEVVGRKVQQLRALKSNREQLRDIRNFEERILLDTLNDMEAQNGNYSQTRQSRSHIPFSDYKAVQDLELEYELLRYKETREQPKLWAPSPKLKSRASRMTNFSPMSNTSMSIRLPQDENELDYQRYNPNQDAQLRQLAEDHGRNMENLSRKNRDLERQKEDIRRRLLELGTKGRPAGDNTSELLAELRAQEARNSKALEDLKQHLYDMKHQRVNVIEYEKQQPYQAPPPPPPVETGRKSYVYPVYFGNSLVAEISAMKQAYLQNGGNDPDVLAQMAQMLAEAQNIEDSMKKGEYDNRHREKKGTNQIQYLDMENERLHKELLLLQEQNFMARERRKTDREDELERQMRRLQEDHLRKLLELQNEIALLKQRSMMEQYKPPEPQTARLPPPPPNNADTPWLLQRPYVEVEQMVPYDQYAGFIIFYDFVLNLDPQVTACRLITGLHSTAAAMGEPTLLPTVYTEPATRATYMQNTSNAVIGARQPVPKCPAQADLGIVVELQTSGGPASEYDKHSLITRGWTKVPVFDNKGQLFAGKFRIPLRNVPIKPFLHSSQLQNIPKFGDAELFYRVVNMRDGEVQSLLNISAANHQQYRVPNISPPPQAKPVSPHIPPPPTASTIASNPEQRLPAIPNGHIRPQDTTIGFQVDRVKKGEYGEGKVRLTAYYASNGKVVQSSTSPVTCSTTSVKSNFKYGYHIFGQQEATFNYVELQGDIVVIGRFYLRKRAQEADELGGQEGNLNSEETLVAWAAVPLVLANQSISSRARRNFDHETMRINSGTHTLKMFYPPVPEVNSIPFEEIPTHRDWKRYGKATLRIHIFQGQPRPGSLTPSDMSEDGEDVLPEYSWLPYERKTPLKDPYMHGDGFDVYIDSARFLPDSATFTKVAGRVLDRKYEVHGKDINTGVKIDSDIYNPVYEEKFEFRETNIPPSATLLLKIYTVDNFYKQLTVVGYATLNIFVESGTERQPPVDKPGLAVSLNEGAHQLRLYSSGPNGVDPLTESCLRDAGTRIVPCASILVRLTKVPKGPSGKALEQSKVPEADWLRLGLHQPRPKYTDRIYYSYKCMPSKGEGNLFHSMMRRPNVTIREAVAKMAKAKENFYRRDKNVEDYIRTKLTKGEARPLDVDLTFICQYSPKQGLKVAVDSAVNLPWTNFTHAHICMNPPGAFYMGPPHATYDKLQFTETLDLKSTNTSPSWRDGYKHFPRRSFHRFLTVIVHLQEVQVTVAKENYKYGLLEQAWTALQVFTDKYSQTATFQLPLFQGSPNPQMLKQLAREPCREWMERNIRSSSIFLIEGASVFVRLADGRRDDELQGTVPGGQLLEVNTDYIPPDLDDVYSKERPGKPLDTMVPPGKTPEQFIDNLALKFKNLVYKLYEEGNMK